MTPLHENPIAAARVNKLFSDGDYRGALDVLRKGKFSVPAAHVTLAELDHLARLEKTNPREREIYRAKHGAKIAEALEVREALEDLERGGDGQLRSEVIAAWVGAKHIEPTTRVDVLRTLGPEGEAAAELVRQRHGFGAFKPLMAKSKAAEAERKAQADRDKRIAERANPLLASTRASWDRRYAEQLRGVEARYRDTTGEVHRAAAGFIAEKAELDRGFNEGWQREHGRLVAEATAAVDAPPPPDPPRAA